MQWHGLRIPIVLMALAMGLMVLLGGQWAYNKYSFQDPLEQKLGELDSVAEYSLNDDGEVLVIKLKLNNPDNLMEEYQKIDYLVRRIVNKGAFRIELVDNRDKALKDAYYKSQFAIQEAIVRGNYRQMAVIVHESAQAVGADARVYVGSRNIYLQMEHGDHYLYEVISRETVPGVSSPVTGGGVVSHD